MVSFPGMLWFLGKIGLFENCHRAVMGNLNPGKSWHYETCRRQGDLGGETSFPGPKTVVFCAVMVASLLAFALPANGQKGMSEPEVLEAIRTGKIKITDEMIEAQRKLHPELKGKSNM